MNKLRRSEESRHKSEKKFWENREKRKLTFLKISRNVNFKMLMRGEFQVFLSAVFGNRQRNVSTSPLCHEVEIFLKQNFKKIEKNKNFHFWKFSGMLTSKCCRKVNFGYFWVRFSGIDRETCQEDHCAIKWNFCSNLCPGSSNRLTNFR